MVCLESSFKKIVNIFLKHVLLWGSTIDDIMNISVYTVKLSLALLQHCGKGSYGDNISESYILLHCLPLSSELGTGYIFSGT